MYAAVCCRFIIYLPIHVAFPEFTAFFVVIVTFDEADVFTIIDFTSYLNRNCKHLERGCLKNLKGGTDIILFHILKYLFYI